MIRSATQKDVEVLAEIIREAFRDVALRFALTRDNCPRHPSNCTTDWIEADMARGVQYFILDEDHKPVGCVGVERANTEVCYLERLAVLPEWRGRHFGRSLVRHALDCAASQGAVRVSIGIIEEQTELKAWYRKLGFSEVQTKSFPHLPFKVCLMEFEIKKQPAGV
jgi:N-acetylglutamate synthase-like GNAT family acetyltransferase